MGLSRDSGAAAVAALTRSLPCGVAQVKAERSTVSSVEAMTAFTVERVSQQNGDPFIAEERIMAEREAAAEEAPTRG